MSIYIFQGFLCQFHIIASVDYSSAKNALKAARTIWEGVDTIRRAKAPGSLCCRSRRPIVERLILEAAIRTRLLVKNVPHTIV
jgi:hypothetical protein